MSELIESLRKSRTLTVLDITERLVKEASEFLLPPEDEAAPGSLLDDVIMQRRLNWLERPIVLLLALADKDDWPDGATAEELGMVLHRGTPEIETQLGWLAKKAFVESRPVDGELAWALTKWVDELAWGPEGHDDEDVPVGSEAL